MSMEAQVNNPLANMVTVNFQDYYIPSMADTDASANMGVLRIALPTGRWLCRLSIPTMNRPGTAGASTLSGITGKRSILRSRHY
jgi:hypothetical protein